MKAEIAPRPRPLMSLYLKILFALLARAIPRSARLSPAIRQEAAELPAGYLIRFALWPAGPGLLLTSDGEGGLSVPPRDEKKQPDLSIEIKSKRAAFRLFTFQESTVASEAAGRLIARGSLPRVVGFIRIMDQVEILLLPRFIARRAVKEWRKPERLHLQRARLYAGIIFGGAL